jgi:glycerophosphoryl diester phosphodiesterase
VTRTDRRVAALPAPPAWLRDVPFAHRGLHDDGRPENSLAAIEAAVAAGVGIEIDVHASRDGVPVVIHDRDLQRVAGSPERVADMPAAVLGRTRLGDSDQTIPTLGAVLDAAATVPVMVEIKNLRPRAGELERAVGTLLAQHRGSVCVSSFNPRALAWFRRHMPEVPRLQAAGPLLEVPMPRLMRWSVRTLQWVRSTRPCAVSYELAGVDDPAVQAYRAAGGTVVTWTVASHADLDRARRFADNVIFESLPVSAVSA